MEARHISTRFIYLSLLFLLSASVATASLVRVDLVPDRVLDSPNQSFGFDIDSNGTTDFIFFYDLYQNGAFLHVNVPVDLQGTNRVIVNGFQNNFGKDQILPLDSGAVISAAALFNGPISGNGPLFAQPQLGGGDIMEGRGDSYIGFRFDRNGATHYGWFLVDVNATGDTATIKEYAYETTPEVPVSIGTSGAVRVERITVAGYSGVTAIAVPGGTLQMEATVSPENATNKAVVWSVNDTTLATIDTAGLLRARGNGSVLVTATSVDNPFVAGSMEITITEQTTTSVRTPSTLSNVAIGFLPESNVLRIDRGRQSLSMATVMLFDITGRRVMTEQIDGAAGTYILDLGSLGSGTYLAHYATSEGSITTMFGIAK